MTTNGIPASMTGSCYLPNSQRMNELRSSDPSSRHHAEILPAGCSAWERLTGLSRLRQFQTLSLFTYFFPERFEACRRFFANS